MLVLLMDVDSADILLVDYFGIIIIIIIVVVVVLGSITYGRRQYPRSVIGCDQTPV